MQVLFSCFLCCCFFCSCLNCVDLAIYMIPKMSRKRSCFDVSEQTNKQTNKEKRRRMSVDIYMFPAYICLSQAGLSHAKSPHNRYTDEWWPQHCRFCPLSPHALPDSQDIYTPPVGRTRTQWLELAFVLGREQLLHFILCFHSGEENQIHFTPQNRFTWSAFESKNVVKKQTCK